MFGNRMQPSAIPERVYALCREIVSRPIEETKLKALLEPQNFGGKQEYCRTLVSGERRQGGMRRF